MVKLLDFWATWCIDPQTSVLTDQGYIPASKIKVDQKLATIDPKTYKKSFQKVQKTRIYPNTPAKKITLETGRTLIGDNNHRVLTQEGFKSLINVSIGDELLVDHIQTSDSKEIGDQIIDKLFGPFNYYAQIKQTVLSRLSIGTNSVMAYAVQPSIHTDVGWGHTSSQTVNPPKNWEAIFTKWLEGRQQTKELLWEKITEIEEVENRDVVGITVGAPHTIITNGIVSHNCGPCKFMEPIIEELEHELKGKIEIQKINVDEEQDVSFKYQVMSIPTYVVEKDGKEVERIVGATSKDNLLKAITKHE